MQSDRPPQPWDGFLAEIDGVVDGEIQFHCLGGFVVTQVYGSARSTSDLDVLTLVGEDPAVFSFAGIGSKLHRVYRVYLDPVGIAPLPEDYESRMIEIFGGRYKNLRLFALDPYDLALAKIERNIERDRDDVKYLFRQLSLDIAELRTRYAEELRPYLAIPEREDLTLALWCEMIAEERSK